MRRALRDALEPEGFASDGGHFVRRRDLVTEVVEIQHSIYGSRITANLGLDLEFLAPLIRWIPRPVLGPHAHDCLRWLRIGLAGAERGDRWWSYDPEEPESFARTGQRLADEVAGPGRAWLERERHPDAFLGHVEKAVARSQNKVQPEGGYLELRAFAAVLAWRGEHGRSQLACAAAREAWAGEERRLRQARAIYARRHPDATTPLGPVPPLQDELEALCEPETGREVMKRLVREG